MHITHVSKVSVRGGGGGSSNYCKSQPMSHSAALTKVRMNEAGKMAFPLLLFSCQCLKQSSTAPKLGHHHLSSEVE